MRYYCLQCPDCGKWSAKQVKKSIWEVRFKCVYCRKSHATRDKDSIFPRLKFSGPYKAPEISKAVAYLNKPKIQDGGKT